ncbi:MAG: hypothetical protein CMI36_13255 [Owenweeksia sp.]|nr:hypothetical protein [Owenweeksia sp.]MBF99955.1 hypothetical protein [Owenweeksia sp.]HBF19523.1 hypothetical protein [Cryomorphaceae bacterium]|tara:strand:+ start:633 stop:833 length:201 start_codon:yes stop_codon:yes gene_type:complete
MKKYYVNNRAQANGDHEVHDEDCHYLPSDRKYLGLHNHCRSAVEAAKAYYRQVNGCKFCSEDCHTQ